MMPSGWEKLKLPEFAWFQEGPGLRKWQFTDSGCKVLNITNIVKGELDLSKTDRHISEEELTSKYSHFLCDAGDIVLASSGNSYCKHGIVREKDLPLVMNTSVIRFKPLKNCDYEFLNQFLKSTYLKKQIDILITGGAQPNFGPVHLKQIECNFPSLLEQRKISSILWTWDKAISTTERLIDNSKQQKKALMQQLLTGKNRLLDDSGKPFEGEWEEVTLGDVITHQKGYAFKSASYLSFGTRIIRISDTNIDSIHDNSPVFINEGSEGDLNSYKLTTGDIILSTVGSRPHLLDSMVGKAVRIPKKDSNSLLNQNLVKLSPVDGVIINEYLYLMLKENRFIYFISTLVRGNANQVSITLKELFSYKLILPLFEEQQKISSVLTNAAKEVELLEQQLADLKQEKKALMQQLLTGKRRVKVDNTEAA